MRIGPIGFLVVVAVGWVGARTVALWPEPDRSTHPRIAVRAPTLRDAPLLVRGAPATSAEALVERRVDALRWNLSGRTHVAGLRPLAGPRTIPIQTIQTSAPSLAIDLRAPDPLPVEIRVTQTSTARFSVSGWALVRSSAAPALATGGQLGGSQAGARARVQLAPQLHAALRLSTPLGQDLGAEAALSLDWRPDPKFPVIFTIERRVGLDRGGRDAFAAGVFGGVDQVRLPGGLRLDGYGQAGIVWLKRRDPYIDGAVRIEGALPKLSGANIALGAGVWGGAQPGAARADFGPQIVLRIPVARGGLRLGAEWRERVAGSARPGSGPTLSLCADF